MQLGYDPRAVKELAKLSPAVRVTIMAKLKLLATSGLGGALRNQIKAVVGEGRLYRLRVGDYRVVFSVVREEATILRIAHRREVYR